MYRLFYPGVLGSMIFDIADPLRPFQLARIGLLSIAIAFIVDFLHMTVDLNAEESDEAKPFLDGAIAFSFVSRISPLPESQRFPPTNPDSLSTVVLAFSCLHWHML